MLLKILKSVSAIDKLQKVIASKLIFKRCKCSYVRLYFLQNNQYLHRNKLSVNIYLLTYGLLRKGKLCGEKTYASNFCLFLLFLGL